MDELELLKKDWVKSDDKFERKSTAQLYPMLLKKSSSIVKTLFYISIAELVFWVAINTIPFLMSDAYRAKHEEMYTSNMFIILSLLSYAIILLFVYLLYRSHKSISVTDNAKKLMQNILKTRKIIKYYVLYNLVLASVSMILAFIYTSSHDPLLAEKIDHFTNKQYIAMIGMFMLVTIVFVAVIWLFYKLLYGILLRRLNRNYKELKKIEV
ncbi:hypothetical protein [Olleya namhaensis]|uniref:Uncharacterized protein n=1 Tax=Olleya namhaensis TaxID=1144750 RepID=A0A1I3PJ72_9FLAO|nr:hypothetical protein [Olleya namhaensis]SFJ21086.1 hypothetical protein SAMN05443431_105126 [Olleya namhaensis]